MCPTVNFTLISSDGLTCVADCAFGEFISVSGTSCVATCVNSYMVNGTNGVGNKCATSCPTTGLKYKSFDNLSCVSECNATTGIYLNTGKTRCIASCGVGEIVIDYQCYVST